MKNKQFKHLMLDIETMGTKPYSAIVSIGAVEFDIETGETGEEFYKRVSLESCEKHGLKIDASTVVWWLQQSEDARKEIAVDKGASTTLIFFALGDLVEFMYNKEYEGIWGNSPSFDCARLREAYELSLADTPWDFRNERDVRTLVSFAPEIKNNTEKPDVAHNALQDCYYQIKYCSAIWKHINNK